LTDLNHDQISLNYIIIIIRALGRQVVEYYLGQILSSTRAIQLLMRSRRHFRLAVQL